MKNTLLGIFFSLSLLATAQVEIPQLSPRAIVKQIVGLTNFTLDYSRPSVRERKIFGELLPYGELWRTGANKNTTLSFDTEITFGGTKVKAGSYAVFMKINEKTWDIYLYADTENWGTPKKWEEEKVVATVSVPVKKSSTFTETFTISFDNLSVEDLQLNFSWENSTAGIKIEMPTDELTRASIEKTMSGPSDRDYYGAADYYLSAGENLEVALEYIKKAVEMRGDEAYWYLRKQALIEHKLGQKKAAIETAKRSLASAEKAGNKQYVEMNRKSIDEWSK
ncbi:MAG: DUF2911 domain-containing protein [Brumimicrobium sp.]|nr:DUF2911 domain-containing protein [Brumimicrobium sp.]